VTDSKTDNFGILTLSSGRKVITSRISGPDKYQWVVLVVCWGVYSSIVGIL
jgi:hypothetical protein